VVLVGVYLSVMSNPSDSPQVTDVTVRPPKDVRFWLVLLSLCTALFLSALELSIVSPALPIITADLLGEDFVWVGSAYGIGSSAILPMTGGLAQIFGRRSTFLGSIALFGIGCIIAGAAKNMGMLIAGRAVQGLGGGGILSLTTIIISDMVSLEERGLFAGAFYGG
jgi:MFS family permease